MTKQMRVYLDNSATSRVDDKVVEEMLPYFSEKYGNASSLHTFGKEARDTLVKCRQKFAKLLNCKPEEIFFTSGGTESDNIAIKGVAYAQRALNQKRKIITSAIEHSAVLKTCKQLEKEGFEVKVLGVDENGFIDIKELTKEIDKNTAIVSIMWANSEIGTIQNMKEIGEVCKRLDVPFHTDAVQALGKVDINLRKLNIDLLAISSHKFHGPKGVGMLYKKKGIKILPIMQGGGHESGLRSGTENIPGIVGMTKEAVENLRKISGG